MQWTGHARAAWMIAFVWAGVAVAQEAPKLTKAPKLVHFVEAPYPDSEKAAGKTASVVLRLTITDKGSVSAAEIATSGGAAFDQAAKSAALQFSFAPAEVDGHPSAIRILFNYDFTLKEVKPTTAIFAGLVRDRAKRKPVAGVTVELDGGLKAVTKADGTFEMKEVPAGPRGLTLSGAGLTSLRTQETFEAGERLDVTYDVSFPEPAAAAGESDDLEIVVVAPPVQKQIVSTSIAADQAVRIPGAQGDVLKVVESMPGVARASAGSSALIVWGAAPGDTRTYVDGVPIPQLYHEGGLRSVVSSDFVKSVELVPGGYGSAYGEGLGGIVLVDTKPLEHDGIHAAVSADLFEAAAMAKADVTDKLRVAVAGEYSYLDQLAKEFVSPTVEEFFPFPRFHDAQARIFYQLGPRESIEVVGLLSGDQATSGVPNSDPTETTSQTQDLNFYRVYLRYRNEVANGTSVTVTPYIGVDQSSLVDTYGSIATSVTSSTTLGGVRATWRSVVATWLTAEAGVDAEIQQSSLQRIGSTLDPPREGDPYVFGEPPPNQLNSDKWKVFFVDVAPYVELDFQPVPKTLHITPGLRFDPYARTVSEAFPTTAGEPATGLDQQNFSFEPRLSVRWDANSRLSLHAAVGRYNEMPAAGDLSAVFGNPTLPTSSATQALAGVAGKITEKLSLEATGFWSNSWDLAVRNPVAAPAAAQALVSHGFGRAYGGQFVLRQEKIGPFFGWVSYTLSRSERQDVPHGPWRLSDYDQTHLLTAVADCDVLWGIDVGLRMRYATGFPRTPVTGAYFDAQLDQYEPVFGAINAVRIPAFFQVDLRIAKAWKIGRSKLDLSLDIQNVTNQANAEEIAYSSDFTRKSYITGLPILPVLGLKWSI